MSELIEKFQLHKKVIMIAGATSMIGKMVAKAILEADGIPILFDSDREKVNYIVMDLCRKFEGKKIYGYAVDLTDQKQIEKEKNIILEKIGVIDGLVNCMSVNQMDTSNKEGTSNQTWRKKSDTRLLGNICFSSVIGSTMALQNGGVILNIIDKHEMCVEENNPRNIQSIAVMDSAIDWGIIGITKCFAKKWSYQNVRVNAIILGDYFNLQSLDYLRNVESMIPLGRLANLNEYIGSIIFLLCDASSYMTGSVVTIDGGKFM